MDVYQIYLVINGQNLKMYVGQTVGGVEARWSGHRSSAKKKNKLKFHNAINKHGTDKFIVTRLAFTFTKDHADELEEYWIRRLHTHERHRGYNCTFGGEGARHTPEGKRKIGDMRIGKPGKKWTEEERKEMSERTRGENAPNWGGKASDATRAKMSLVHSGEKNAMFGKKGADHPKFGKKLTEAACRKISERVAGENNGMYGRVGVLNPAYGKPVSPEAKKILSEKAKERMKTTGVIPFKGRKHTEESKQKMRETKARKRALKALGEAA